VIQALIGAARHLGVLAHDVEIFVKAALPVLLAVVTEVELLAQGSKDCLPRGHCLVSSKKRCGSATRPEQACGTFGPGKPLAAGRAGAGSPPQRPPQPRDCGRDRRESVWTVLR